MNHHSKTFPQRRFLKLLIFNLTTRFRRYFDKRSVLSFLKYIWHFIKFTSIWITSLNYTRLWTNFFPVFFLWTSLDCVKNCNYFSLAIREAYNSRHSGVLIQGTPKFFQYYIFGILEGLQRGPQRGPLWLPLGRLYAWSLWKNYIRGCLFSNAQGSSSHWSNPNHKWWQSIY